MYKINNKNGFPHIAIDNRQSSTNLDIRSIRSVMIALDHILVRAKILKVRH